MDKPRQIITSYSLPHLLSVPPVFPNGPESDYYAGLFEFPQGSSPKIVWDNKGKSVSNREAFLLYVVNIPTDLRINTYNPKPTLIKSEFMGATFIAAYVQIPDIEARGFARSIVLVIAHHEAKMIGYIYANLLDQFESIALELQENASDKFPKDLSEYASSMRKTMENNPNSAQLLRSKSEELKNLMKKVGIEEDESDSGQEQTSDYFLRINNELRSIITLTRFKDVKNSFLTFIYSLPKDVLQCNSMWNAQECLMNVINSSHDDLASDFQVLFKNKRIFDCIYTLLTGHSLYIISSKPGLSQSIGSKFAALTPFESSFPLVSVDMEIIDPSIVIAANFEPSLHTNDSCLDMDKDKYIGIKCPSESILYKELPKTDNHSTQLLLMMFSNDLKKIGSRFIRKTIEMSARAPQTRERMDAQMKTIGFAECDLPLIQYWSKILHEQEDIDSSSLDCYL